MKISCAPLLALLTALPAAADVVGPGGKMIDCYCTDQTGGRIELGELICLRVDGQTFMAQCQMSLNVPMWRKVEDGCSSVEQMSKIGDPAIDAGLVDAHI